MTMNPTARRWFMLAFGFLAASVGSVADAAEPKSGEVIENSIKMKLVYVPQGEFDMGSPESEKDRQVNETLHHVKLTKGLYVGAHEVTVGQFREFVTKSKYETDAESDGKGGVGLDDTKRRFEQ